MHQAIATPAAAAPPRKKRRSRTKRYLLIAGGVLLLWIIVSSILSRREKPIPVTTDKAVRRTIVQTVSATGKIQPEIEVKISPEVAGEIIDLPVNTGWVQRQDHDPDGARSSFAAALRISRHIGDRSGIAYASLGLACLAADAGDWRRAAILHGVAQAFLDPTGQPWEELEARYRQDSLAQVRARLGQEQFEPAYSSGMTLSFGEALDLASGKALPASPAGVT